jgi:hypothetical protein
LTRIVVPAAPATGMSLMDAVPYTAFSGVQVLPGAALAAITPADSSGLSPVRLDGADSTAGAPGGGAGVKACAGLAKPTASTPPQAAFRCRRHTRLTVPPELSQFRRCTQKEARVTPSNRKEPTVPSNARQSAKLGSPLTDGGRTYKRWVAIPGVLGMVFRPTSWSDRATSRNGAPTELSLSPIARPR